MLSEDDASAMHALLAGHGGGEPVEGAAAAMSGLLGNDHEVGGRSEDGGSPAMEEPTAASGERSR